MLAAACCAAMSPTEADTLARTLTAVEVTAKAPANVSATAPVHVIDRQAMTRGGVTSVSEAVHRMPGVTLRDYGGAGGLKTVSVRGFGPGHTGVSYDGIPLSDVQSGQIDLSRYYIDNLQRISLVIGDNEDIFVPARLAASAATLGISTMGVRDGAELTAQLRGGSFGYINPFVRVGTPLSSTVSVNVVAEYTHARNDYPFRLVNGDVTTIERRTNSMMDCGHAEANVAWEIDRHSSLLVKAYHYDNRRQLPGPVIYYNNVSHERLRESNTFGQARYRATLTPRLSLMANAKYNLAVSKYHDENGKYPGGVLDQNYWQREYYASAALLYVPTDRVMMDYSADYYYNNLNSNLPRDRRPWRHSMLQSLTAKYRTPRLIAMARLLHTVCINGARTGASARDANRLSPSLSLSYKVLRGQNLYVRASYKNIFRMPTFNEAYFEHYGSADVLPETTDQVNAGVTYSAPAAGAMRVLTVTTDAYVNHIRDMIVAVPYNMFVWRMTNLGRVRAIGVDVTVNAEVQPAQRHTLSLTGNYSYQRAAPRTDPQSSDWMKQVAYIPRHSGCASVAYENPWVNLSVHCTAVSDCYTTNNNIPSTRIDGYAEFGATAWREVCVGRCRVELRADLINMFDRQYCVVARYPMPGRSWQLTASLKL